MDKEYFESDDVNVISESKEVVSKRKKNNLFGGIKNIFSKISNEDLLLFGILFLLIEEGIEDEFLIIVIVILLLTGED